MTHIPNVMNPNKFNQDIDLSLPTATQINLGLDDAYSTKYVEVIPAAIKLATSEAVSSLVNPSLVDINTYVKPTVQEELSKIWEELATQNQTISELRHESTRKDEIIDQQQKENKKVKAKLKKERAKNKSNNNQMQKEIDEIQQDMNKVKNILDFKRYINGL